MDPGTASAPLRVVFGSRGAGVAWVVQRADGGGREAPSPEGSVVNKPVIRPGGAGVGVLVASGEGAFLREPFNASEGGDAQRHDEAAELAYSADGRSRAFCARRRDSWFGVKDGAQLAWKVEPL